MIFKDFIQFMCDDLFINLNDSEIPKIKRFINRGYKELAKRQKYAEYTILTDTGMFGKPIYCKKIVQVIKDNYPLEFSEVSSVISVATSGTLTVIYEIDINLVPDLISDNDTPVTDMRNDKFILDYAKELWYSKENKKEYKAEIYVRNYENYDIVRPKKILQFTVER